MQNILRMECHTEDVALLEEQKCPKGDHGIVDTVGKNQGQSGTIFDLLPAQAPEDAQKGRHNDLQDVPAENVEQTKQKGRNQDSGGLRRNELMQLVVEETPEEQFFHGAYGKDAVGKLRNDRPKRLVTVAVVYEGAQPHQMGHKGEEQGHSNTQKNAHKDLPGQVFFCKA